MNPTSGSTAGTERSCCSRPFGNGPDAGQLVQVVLHSTFNNVNVGGSANGGSPNVNLEQRSMCKTPISLAQLHSRLWRNFG